MALIAIAADKGAPGVTTTAVALAALWPRRALLAEADPAGGDLIYRSVGGNGRPLDPGTGILSLAATARRGIAAEQLWDHTQRLAGGLDVIVGLASAEQAAGLTGQWSGLGKAFAELAQSPHQEAAADVIADLGRLGPDSPAVALLPHAALLLLVTRTRPEQLARVRDRAQALSGKLHGGSRSGAAQLGKPQIGVVLLADPQQGARIAGQVNEMLIAGHTGARVVGLVADDPAGADMLAGRRRGRVDKSLLVRSARKIVSDLQQNFRAELTSSGGPGQTGGHPVQHPGGAGAPGSAPPPAPEGAQGYAPRQPPAPGGVAGPYGPGPYAPGPSGPAAGSAPGEHGWQPGAQGTGAPPGAAGAPR
ncbi:hypothetical protein [Streptomyces aidingensis]|uniref:Cellulose biosynthesis protein BcsQ n=1 Tax=Streptomyces aidingensis TaxID=910347 RepID=A0A1I1F430_9ACTN|nr:hypothetical protein [Streptomyces aidingensis]SFB94145.1 hypothetical protein SAMN05421773_101612 [Streptomyces aidingensis]